MNSQKQQEQIQQKQQQNQKPEIKIDENRKIKLLHIDFNLETLNSKKKKKKIWRIFRRKWWRFKRWWKWLWTGTCKKENLKKNIKNNTIPKK